MAQTLAEENYLKAIYGLSVSGDDKITLTTIADKMKVNPATVIDMIKKLADKNLLHYDKKKGVKLSISGENEALHIIRKHRLWEVFLFTKLGYTWDEIHDVAEQLEHIQDDTLADRLDQFLGFPEYDPHGDPIPKANGRMPKFSKTLLADINLHKVCKVVAIKDTSTIFLQYLKQLNVDIGSQITVLDKISFDDSMVIRIGENDQTTVSKKFTESIFVA